MLMLVLIGLSLVLTGVAGLQFTYLFHADKMTRERRKHLKALEQKCVQLTRRLEAVE